MSRSDRIIGIVLGLLVGVAAVIIFVFVAGGSSVDSPSLEGGGAPASAPANGPGDRP